MSPKLLANAVESIAVGLQDYKSGGKGRLRSAVRNLHAGILLLFKEKLRRLSPPGSGDVLLKSRIIPTRSESGEIRFVGAGKKTVNVQETKDRFKELGVTADWEAFDDLDAIRNDVEHFHERVEHAVIEEAVAKGFDVLDRFIRDELAEDPLNLLGRESWEVLLTAKEVFERERAECETRIEAVDWESDVLLAAMLDARCESCGSSLVVPKGGDREAGIQCRACQADQDFDDAAETALKRHYSWESYVAMDDGGDPPLAECPTCNRPTYLWEDNVCVLCGDTFDRDCGGCGSEILPSEFTCWGLCGYCDYVMSKDD